MSETKPKKMVSRNIAVALGIICIVLIALIAHFTVTGISAQNSYNNLQNQNKQFQAWLNGNETLLSQTQIWLYGNATLLNNLTDIVNLGKSTILVSGQEFLPTDIVVNVAFAGYISFQINLDANVTVYYIFHGVRYDNTTFIPRDTIQFYPVLPTNITISIFEFPIILSDVPSSVTITYYY